MSRILFCTSALVLGISAASLLTASPAMAQTATYSVVANFTDGAEGGYPVTALIQGASGNFLRVKLKFRGKIDERQSRRRVIA